MGPALFLWNELSAISFTPRSHVVLENAILAQGSLGQTDYSERFPAKIMISLTKQGFQSIGFPSAAWEPEDIITLGLRFLHSLPGQRLTLPRY